MSDQTIIQACFEYFLGCLWPCLIEIKDAKSANACISNMFASDIFIQRISTDNISSIYISLFNIGCSDY